MAINFTTPQKQAIDSRGNRLIVSAAAGSGKTAVLVQRVIELICDPDQDCSVDRLVVVTFTSAAASEMRSRIAGAIHQRLVEDPENTRLRRQLALLPSARIQTVHSFCQGLVRQNFTKCGVTADFRLLDEEESSQIRDEVLDRLLEEEYRQDRPAFRQLCNAMRENRGDARLVKAITGIYRQVLSMPQPERWLTAVKQQSARSRPEDTDWGSYTLELVRGQLQRAQLEMQQAQQLLNLDVENMDVWRKYYAGLAQQLDELVQAQEQGWDRIRERALAFNWGRAPGKKIDPGIKEELIRLRDGVKKRVSVICGDLIVADAETIKTEQQLQGVLVGELCDLTIRLLEQVWEEKRRRNLLDFSDLEHRAYQLLTAPEGGPSQLAREISAQISELLVDEYQDTNELQDAIFRQIAPEKGGVFMVGDLKQSIYRFRMAEPGIFLDKYRSSVPLEDGMSGADAKLALNMNFRSSHQVLDLCNFIFERLMSERFGGIDYDENERLNVKPDDRGDAPCELWLLEKPPKEESREKTAQVEARFVAARISQMLGEITVTEKINDVEVKRPARPEDFAILLSSYTSREPYYSQELQKLHIPVAAASRGEFWNSPEVLTVLSFLRIIDNRRQDVPLIGLMRSPVYLFTVDELAQIRLCDKRQDYIDAVEMAAPSMPKAAHLLADLERYADLACDMSVSQLMRTIYEEKSLTGIFAAMENGDLRRDNLEQLLNLAVRFEQGGSKGLYRFLQYLDRMIEKDRQPEAADGQAGVRIMSIHKSKGLEFPVVFMPDLNKEFNEQDLREPVLMHKESGIAMKLRFPELHAEIKTQVYKSTARRIQSDSRGEELRKLYVGMTRARERLVLSAAMDKPEKFLEDLAALFGRGEYDPLVVSERGKMSDWVFGTLLQHPGAEVLRSHCGRLVRVAPGCAEDLQCRILHHYDELAAHDFAETAVARSIQKGPEDSNSLLALIDQTYAHEASTKLPSKLTPTGLKRLVPETAEIYAGPAGNAIRLYHAASGEKGSAAERGSANHLALSTLPLEQCWTREGTEAQLALARQEKRIPEATLALVDPDWVLRFTAGPLGDRTMAAERYLREYEFGVLLPPERLLGGPETGEQILVNGVIDLLLFEGDSVTIIDFKTDNVKPGMAEEAARKHRLQLEIYAQAAAEVFGLPVRERIVFFLRTGEWARV